MLEFYHDQKHLKYNQKSSNADDFNAGKKLLSNVVDEDIGSNEQSTKKSTDDSDHNGGQKSEKVQLNLLGFLLEKKTTTSETNPAQRNTSNSPLLLQVR